MTRNGFWGVCAAGLAALLLAASAAAAPATAGSAPPAGVAPIDTVTLTSGPDARP